MPRKGRPKPRVLSAPIYRGPIPRVKGPRLDEFPHREAPIEFRRLLSNPESGQSHVFEVSINSRIYALKVFKFYDDDEDDSALYDFQKEVVSLDELHAHADPFYNECRAYGRLREAGLDNGEVAIRCHGYTTLDPAMEPELEQRFGVTDWDRDDDDSPTENKAAFRAIVKDLVRDDIPLTHRVAKKMKKDLLQIRRQGIYTSDIKKSNYKNGLLLDFSNAITEPNYLFEIKPEWQVERYKQADLIQFDQMIEDEKVKTWVRATPNMDYLRKLRPRNKI